MAKFDLGEYLKTVAVPESGADGPEQLLQIPLTQLRADERNFYAVDGIEALAANIQLCGLMDPLRVRKAGDSYIIVSGHRRFAALKLLAQDDERFSTAACILEPDGISPAMQELRLIYANNDTRRMSAADLGRQAARVQALLYELKESGVEFPGRMRDHVAEACKVSKSKLSRLAAIEAHLAPDIRRSYWRGKDDTDLRESAAYELSQLPRDVQRQVIDCWRAHDNQARWLPSSSIAKIREAHKEIMRTPLHGGAPCQSAERKVAHVVRTLLKSQWARVPCGSTCCVNCTQLVSCKDRCTLPEVRTQWAALKQQAAEDKAQAAERKAAMDRSVVERISSIWSRFGELREAAGLSVDDFLQAMDAPYMRQRDAFPALESGDLTQFTSATELPYGYNCSLSQVDRWLKAADLLGCSVDYLMCRTDDPHPRGGADSPLPGQQMLLAGWMPGGTISAHDCDCLVMAQLGEDGDSCPYRMTAHWRGGVLLYSDNPRASAVDLPVLAWIEIPEWPGKGGS